ncbi:MaoC family dehydratase [Bartonella schoenbuchensis]|uniref:Acyl dehydratase n=2 Tax=Bartonella schoenbuchensis TaxID=165694 RepID=E6Z0K9_BARSR|nr:MaoC family dehydratase [Bartonella schoenbuchensis]AQX31117.1 Acyl dehydratase [Bartonella schoenbuchensis R1]CBI82647.1 Acyl dehydratase [Bartonella schoenbuchensis R1]CDP80522.1 nodulation protein N [Bartonella schoenbuchensis]
MQRTIAIQDIKNFIGKEIGLSQWRLVTQDMINQFASATDDHQWIHVDEEKAKKTPFGGTIAHGFLTLSLLSTLAYEALPKLEGATMGINYGFDKIRFVSPVKTGAQIRARFILDDAKIRPSGRVVLHYKTTIEINKLKNPALIAHWLVIAMIEEKEINSLIS